jgi:hypothetical protein
VILKKKKKERKFQRPKLEHKANKRRGAGGPDHAISSSALPVVNKLGSQICEPSATQAGLPRVPEDLGDGLLPSAQMFWMKICSPA